MAVRTHPMPVSTTPQQHNLLQLPGKLDKKSKAIRKETRKDLTLNCSLSLKKKSWDLYYNVVEYGHNKG